MHIFVAENLYKDTAACDFLYFVFLFFPMLCEQNYIYLLNTVYYITHATRVYWCKEIELQSRTTSEPPGASDTTSNAGGYQVLVHQFLTYLVIICIS